MAAAQNRLDDHHRAVSVAEAAHQQALKVAVTETDRINARIAYYRAVLASGRANGVSTGAAAALARLGAAPQDLRDGDT
jgi:hypothetical protein